MFRLSIKYLCFLFFIQYSLDVTAEEIGEISTKFNIATPNDKILVVAFDDPDINGVTCYLSRSVVGGFLGTLGLAEDTSDASIACRQTDEIKILEEIESGKKNGKKSFKPIHLFFSKHSKWCAFMMQSEMSLSI